MGNADLLHKATERSFSSNTMELRTILSGVQTYNGTFKGQVQWCESLVEGHWRLQHLEITEHGSLRYRLDSATLTSSCIEDDTFIFENVRTKAIIEHLQSCVLQLIEGNEDSLPTIKVELKAQQAQYLRVEDPSTFESLFFSLLWWSALKPEGVFSKTLLKAPSAPEERNPTKLLVSQLFVYGPLPQSKNIGVLQLSRPSFFSETDAEEGWFPAMGVLKSNGILDLHLQSDGSLIYSFDITILTRSEIRLVDSSLNCDNFLFMGVLPKLREQLNLSSACRFILNGRTQRRSSGVVFKFPLTIDVEDWIVALKSFALAESISLIGSHDSNRLRVSNRFKVSIIEGSFTRSDLMPHSPTLYVECLLWDRIWARTPIVSGSFTPFWREEFMFHESTRIDKLRIEIKEKGSQKNRTDKTIGVIELSQESICDGSLSKETRLPVLSPQDKKIKIGTLCIKITSSLNFVLPSVNFTTFERILSEDCHRSLANYVNDSSFAYDFKFEDFAMVLLDIFQAIGKENAWLSALIDRELVDVDGSITRNTINNKTSSHIYSTLFRGNSALTKSMEKYFYRIGKEYLDNSIGSILRQIVYDRISCEVDPSRIDEPDPERKRKILEKNRETLLNLVESIWVTIYKTSNDLPMSIKTQMKTFRTKVELICMGENSNTIVHCVSSLLFLRFFCPVILNPKLFDFVRSHLDDTPRRTLTLVSKVLLNLSIVTYFGKKEPYMVELNDFIGAHKEEVLDYVDKVTQKKLDFSPKTLKLSSSLSRPKLTMNEDCLIDLPSNPYLIDRYLRETELFTALATVATERDGDPKILQSVSIEQITKNVAHLEVSSEHKVLDIGELEFEKITNNNTEVFGSDLMKYLEKENSSSPVPNEYLQQSFKDDSARMKVLEQESILLINRSEHLKQVFSDYEIPAQEIKERVNHTQYLIKNSYYNKDLKVFVDGNAKFDKNEAHKRLFDLTTGRCPLLESLIPDPRIEYAEGSSASSSWNSPSVKTRGFSRLKSTKIQRKLTKSSEDTKRQESTSVIKRWFKRGT
ncbi:hypothetical protein HG535_0D03510 [Zygotorulaspora mrakii]|uniref:Ras-GAP domain-containing protein n=1 Tax=Zygotorulaspora mrakii TaxID=42260 RepID=A0A7H9B2C5_ZYGMR|nr:uncharacterized protein HG535_0D03510 [Zygotorulaspora mrakii]QLG72643.1 hypothetical protein HG535_0D03510 [Zygotorulaspora mrakii]